MDEKLREMLRNVQKPGRYTGGEINSVRKEFSGDMTSVVLAYPDIYEVGMSYLGLKILYHLLNDRDDVVCERVFAPWTDMEEQLRENGRRLFSLESKTDMNKFDIVGFSLCYELTYTNVLNMLDLGGITVWSKDRGEDDPFVIAGGTCCYNPEPMSAFIDAFIMGDGEKALPEFIDEYRKLKQKGLRRKEILKSLSRLGGVYVPSLYDAEYSGGWFSGIKPLEDDVPERIEKAQIEDLENAYYPVKQIVPFIKTVHDRIAVEIMRGCPNKCRFCQAGAVNQPLRLRSTERIREICREAYRSTGYERMALLSLSSVNYPHLFRLVTELNQDFQDKGVGISIPSLKVDKAFYDIPEMLATIRKGGLTFAPETASEDIRRSIRKDVDEEVLRKSALLAYQHGWKKLKLYFMVGFPGETEDQARKIAGLAGELSRLRKKVSKGAAEVRVSVNPFIPKPHTPFQWLGMREKAYLSRVRDALMSRSSRMVKIDFNDIDQSILESCLARGDRRIGDVLFASWKKGAKMDGWKEFFYRSVWEEAFRENGLNLEEIATKTYSVDDPLPWGHIKAVFNEEQLGKEFERSGFFIK